jgi:hypothetical protein
MELLNSSSVVDASLSLSGVSSDDLGSPELEGWESDSSEFGSSYSSFSASGDGSVALLDNEAE